MRTLLLTILFALPVGLMAQDVPFGQTAPYLELAGTDSQTSQAFTTPDKAEVRWSGMRGTVNVTVLAADGSVVAGASGLRGSLLVAKGGTYHLQVDFKPYPAASDYQSTTTSTPPASNGPSAFENTVNRGFNDQPSNQNSNPSPSQPSNPSPNPTQTHSSYTSSPPGWSVMVIALGGHTVGTTPAASVYSYNLPANLAAASSGTPPPTATAATALPMPGASPTPPATPQKMTEDQARAVVLIKGDNAEGTGFMIKTPNGPAVITNIHVIAKNPNLKITTNTGALVTVLSEKGASDRDLAMLSIQDAGYSYLQFSSDISKDVQPGDEVITPGNSQGGEVMLNTTGKLLGVGPVRLEIDNPIYHGNSGGPVFHTKSGKVLGVVTEAEKIEVTNDLDKASFASRNSAISGSMRYFGLRLDTVSAWIPIDSRRFQNETTFLDEFHEQSRRLDAYLNHTDSDREEAARLYHADAKIMKANDDYLEHSSGADTAQHIDLVRSLIFDLQCVADLDVESIKDKTNFYSFDQDRAQDEYDYRKALKSELDSISNNVERASFLPRSNN